MNVLQASVTISLFCSSGGRGKGRARVGEGEGHAVAESAMGRVVEILNT
jgi:hypothetical protein